MQDKSTQEYLSEHTILSYQKNFWDSFVLHQVLCNIWYKQQFEQEKLKETQNWKNQYREKYLILPCNSKAKQSEQPVSREAWTVPNSPDTHLNTCLTVPRSLTWLWVFPMWGESRARRREGSCSTTRGGMALSQNRWWWKPFLNCSLFLGNRLN